MDRQASNRFVRLRDTAGAKRRPEQDFGLAEAFAEAPAQRGGRDCGPEGQPVFRF